MQKPAQKTKDDKCYQLAVFAGAVMEMYEGGETMKVQAAKMLSAGEALKASRQSLTDAILAAVRYRAIVQFVEYKTDECLRKVSSAAEQVDGRRGGRVFGRVFSNGLKEVTDPRGWKQVEAMKGLESRLAGVTDIWPEAEAEKAKVTAQRERLEQALRDRDAAAALVRERRANRDAVKERFLDTYSEIADTVKATFPRDARTQDLFFDRVTGRARRTAGDDADDSSGEE